MSAGAIKLITFPPPSLKDRLARTLRKQRIRRRWSLHDAATVYGMSTDAYQKLEDGQLNATLQTLERVCERLKVDVRALFEL
jgi:DNA-binding Xre family transcriptional regulator